jgi:rifampicin phosphotransferase
MTTMYVRPLDDPAPSLEALGGKGESLAKLVAAGLPVPAGFHITTAAYRAFIANHQLEPEIVKQTAALAGTDAEALEAPAAHLRELFTSLPMPAAVAHEIEAGYVRLGSPPVAVRSSATAEDLPDASFAGQQDSFLNVTGFDRLVDAVQRCWASLWTERAVRYRSLHGIEHSSVELAVVVQRLVNADAAGVMLTADPVIGDTSVIEINAAWGLGEAVVSGSVTADSFTVDRNSGRLLRSVIMRKPIMTVPDIGGITDQPVPDGRQAEPSLSEAQVRELAALGTTIADLYARPMDVEWCRTGDQLFVLQARPITTLNPPDPWNDSRDGDFLWTNTNVGEAIPDVMTPATWSMVQVFLHDAMATASIPPFVGYGRIGGRIYLNVSVMRTLSGAFGVPEKRFRDLTEEVFGRLPDDLEIPPVQAPRLAILRGVLPMAIHVLGEARRDKKILNRYLADHPRRCEQRRAEIAASTSADELGQLWTDVLDPEFNRVSWMLSAATRSSGASFVTTRKRLQRLVGDAAANALTAGLGAQAGQLASLGLLDGLDQLDRAEIDRETFNRRYGHRGPHEFEISTPRPAEDPHWIDQQLEARAPAGYRELLATQQAARAAAWAELEDRHPWHARVLHRQLAHWAEISRDRERARTEVIRYFWVLRAFALRAGELTALGEDIFFLEGREIIRALQGETLSPRLIGDRRAAYQAYCSLPKYPALIRGPFDPYRWAANPNRRIDRYVLDSQAPSAGPRRPSPRAGTAISGFPGSSGIVEAHVRVLADAADGSAFRSGEVLVTTVTNVGWTPLFPRAAAVITDVGAPLSHAAIVARELGIPAVVGCGDATMRLKTGDRVRVDGTAGTVELLSTGRADSTP